jgi:hypothetical protein
MLEYMLKNQGVMRGDMPPFTNRKIAERGYWDGATFGFAEQTKGSERPKPERKGSHDKIESIPICEMWYVP